MISKRMLRSLGFPITITGLQILCCVVTVLFSAPLAASETAKELSVHSPDGHMVLTFELDGEGAPVFSVTYREHRIVEGRLGLQFAEGEALQDSLRVLDAQHIVRDETYAIPVGKSSTARDHHRELDVLLEEQSPPHRQMRLVFRAFDDGVAFRYALPVQESLAEFVLLEEPTSLCFSDDTVARILPLHSFTTSYENYYERLPLSDISSRQLIGLPMLLEPAEDGSRPWIAITEAGLTDYAGMYLSSSGEPASKEARKALVARLSPLPGREDGAKVLGTAPFNSPWRVLMIADELARLLESHLVFHLNDPPAIDDSSWITPGKTTFPWWNGYVLDDVDFTPGVNTETMKYYIDFCAEQGIPYHTLDGLDVAWYGGPIQPTGPTDVTTATPALDLPAVLQHANEKGVRLRLWMHWQALQPQIDEAFKQYKAWGIEGVMVDFMNRDDQEMVRFYHELAEKAASHRLTVTLHGSYKPTGMERTWPNVLSYESVLNQEYNKWEGPEGRGATPKHNLDVAFVRTLAGPLDYHQGGMRSVLPENYQWRRYGPPVQGTRGHQLAMYVVYQNHLSMLADSPSVYRGQPSLEFLVEVPANWDETRVLHAEIDKSIVIARRQGEDWWLGGMTAGEPVELEVSLDFLSRGTYVADLYFDVEGEPTKVTRATTRLTRADRLPLAMQRDGGFVGRLRRSND